VTALGATGHRIAGQKSGQVLLELLSCGTYDAVLYSRGTCHGLCSWKATHHFSSDKIYHAF
jgi:hypothetical protein